MIWYMGLDKDNKPNGWDVAPWGNAIEVGQVEYNFASYNPNCIWNGIVLVNPDVMTAEPPPLTYQQQRAALYAPIPEQLDMQYRDAMNGTTEWFDHITYVKTTVPKV